MLAASVVLVQLGYRECVSFFELLGASLRGIWFRKSIIVLDPDVVAVGGARWQRGHARPGRRVGAACRVLGQRDDSGALGARGNEEVTLLCLCLFH